MSDADIETGSARPDTIKATITYELADLEAYRTQARRRHDARDTGNETFVVMFFVVVLAIAAGFVAFGVGAVPDIQNPAVAVLCGVTYYSARFFRRAYLNTPADPRVAQSRRAPSRDLLLDRDRRGRRHNRLGGYSALVGLASLSAGDVEGGLITFWLREMEGVILPRRFLSDAEAERILAIARSEMTAAPAKNKQPAPQ